MPPTRGRENSNLFSGTLDLKLTSRSYALRFQLWGAHAPRVPISAPRRNASLAQPKEIVGEAPTTAGARVLPGKSSRTAKWPSQKARSLFFVGLFIPTQDPMLRLLIFVLSSSHLSMPSPALRVRLAQVERKKTRHSPQATPKTHGKFRPTVCDRSCGTGLLR
jgi:hypothetical protein